MQPEFLFVKLQRIMRVSKVQTVFDQDDPRRRELEPRVFEVKLVGKNNQIQRSTLKLLIIQSLKHLK